MTSQPEITSCPRKLSRNLRQKHILKSAKSKKIISYVLFFKNKKKNQCSKIKDESKKDMGFNKQKELRGSVGIQN